MAFDDRQGRRVDVKIYRDDYAGTAQRLTAGASPLVLQEDDSEGLDTPARGWTGHLGVFATEDDDLTGLYAADVTDVRVEAWRGGSLIWQGYVVPEVVRQSWGAEGEELTFNVQSPLEALAGLTLEASRGFGIVTLAQMVGECADLVGGAWTEVAVPVDLMLPAAAAQAEPLMMARVARYAFFSREADEADFDDTQTPVFQYTGRTGREVLEAIARLLGCTLMERGRRLIFAADGVTAYELWQTDGLSAGRYDYAEEPAPAARLVDSLTPASADHTESRLRGYRRVRVTFTPAVESELLGGMDARCWEAAGVYDFEEDEAFNYADTGEAAGHYVVYADPPLGGSSSWASPAVSYSAAYYEGEAVDGVSGSALYPVLHNAATDAWELSLTGTYDLTHWSQPTGRTDYDFSSFAGARRAWLSWRTARATSRDHDPVYYVDDLDAPRRKSGILFWPLAGRNHVVDGLEGREIFRVESTAQAYFTGGAFRLALSASGFYCLWGENGVPALGASDKPGPWPVTRDGAVTSWPMRLQIGDSYYYNGTGWQTEPCDFQPELVGGDSEEDASLKPTGRPGDSERYADADDGYIIPLTDTHGDDLMVQGYVRLTLYAPAGQTRFNPIVIHDVSLEHLRPAGEDDPYSEEGETDGAHHYLMATGGRFADDVREAELELGTWNGDRAAYNLLFDAQGEPVTSVTSWRQLGHRDRPERLVCRNMARLYGRAARQLTVEVDAAALDPRAALTGSDGRRYALAGVEWDVRDDTCRYTLEDYTPWDEWTMDS